MYERILIPLDGSKLGESALSSVEELVTKLSPETKVEITLLQVLTFPSHVYITDEYYGTEIAYSDKEIESFKQNVNKYLEKVAESLKGKGATVTTKVATGNAAEEIIKAADEINADLVAMSTHGRSGLSRWAFGSVTDRVLRGGAKPVLVVRAPQTVEKG